MLDWCAPRECLLCREPACGLDICGPCLDDLPWLGAGCRGCGLSLPGPGAEFCAGCVAVDPSSRPSQFIAALAYEFPVDRLVARLKYSRLLAFGRLLGDLLAIRIHEERRRPGFRSPELLVPVPLHPWRLLQRGFNQATEIARVLAAEHDFSLAIGSVRRVRNTPRQASLSRAARLNNVAGAFVVDRELACRRLAIVDDVVTSTATTMELLRTLRRAGAAEVQVWTVARTRG